MCRTIKIKLNKKLLTLFILALFLVLPHLQVIRLAVDGKIRDLLLIEVFGVNGLPDGLGPYENIFERIFIHFLLNLDHVRLFLGIGTVQVGPILLAAREHGDDDELIEAFVLLLRQIESLQHFYVLQFVRVGFPT